MRKRANVFLMVWAAAALQLLSPVASSAIGDDPADPAGQDGEKRWVPSLAITGGATIQTQKGEVASALLENGALEPIPLQGAFDGDDLAVSPYVGVALELMAPAFAIPTRPRLFVSGEILPSFGTDRRLALDGDPDCVSGPEPTVPCAKDEQPGERLSPFGEASANGQGSTTTATVDTLVYGANLGVAFPARIGKRQLRIKPYVGWINYKVDAEGLVVDAACDPFSACTDWGDPVQPGFLRETTLTGSDSQRFNGIGPGIDIEMDAARYGPLGASLFLGAGAYYIVGDRTIEFNASESFDDQLVDNPPGVDTAAARFKVEVDPWLFRAQVGIRIRWLGSQN
jgi:hypothetical protein